MQPTLELRGLSKSFGHFQAVRDLTLAVPPATIFGLLGPNGAGKTTTIRMIMDIMGPDEGQVLFWGRPRTRKDLDRVGYLPEERGLYRKMTVTEQLLFLGELHDCPKSRTRPAIESWLEKLEIGDRAHAKIEELSKGMQQKIQLVGTLLHEPDLLILDEPFSGLDPINQGLFKDVLAEFKEEGRTILFSTHVMEQAEKLCDHIGLIAKGRVVLHGELAAIKRELSGRSFRVRCESDLDGLEETEGVESVVGENGVCRILLSAEADDAAVLKSLVERYPIREFSSEEPTLEEIFVKAVHDAE